MGRLRVTYLLAPQVKTLRRAHELALEQTVEVVDDVLKDWRLRMKVVGRIDELRPLPGGAHEVEISYDPDLTAYQIPQLLNVLYGNTSLQPDVRVVRVDLPAALVKRFPGPRHGVAGVRALTGVTGRPLVASAVKPLGLSPKELADMAYRLARGGIDIIKDDHGLADHAFCPFRERVVACVEAVARAAAETGHRALYVPNLADRTEVALARALEAQELGADGLMIAPMLMGLDFLRLLAEHPTFRLPIMAHPALAGGFFAPGHGLAEHVLLGTLYRLAGADMVIFPSFSGRFAFTEEICRGITGALRAPLHGLKAALPVPAGGLSVESVPLLRQVYGDDVVFLIGSSLYRRSPDLEGNARFFLDMVEASRV